MVEVPLISVIICTYRRPKLLHDALMSLCQQTFDPTRYEIVVVDNALDTATQQTTAKIQQEYPMHEIHYLTEPQTGLSHARNRGWQAACGQYAAYLDDDAKAPQTWLQLAASIIEQFQPAAFGGPYRAFHLSPKPDWFRDDYEAHQETLDARPLQSDEYLAATNMFFQRKVLAYLHGFDPHLGMAGRKVAYAEETELLKRLRIEIPDALVFYDPSLFVYHLVKPERMRLSHLIRQRFVKGRYTQRIADEQGGEGCLWLGLRIVWHIILTLWRLAVYGLLRRDRSHYPFWQNYFYEETLLRVQWLGGFIEQLR